MIGKNSGDTFLPLRQRYRCFSENTFALCGHQFRRDVLHFQDDSSAKDFWNERRKDKEIRKIMDVHNIELQFCM
jgi:hypothetical protein